MVCRDTTQNVIDGQHTDEDAQHHHSAADT